MANLRRVARSPHLGAAALRGLLSLVDPRRRLYTHLLFLRQSTVAGAPTWVPRPWWNRASTVVRSFRSQTVRIHRGFRWRRLLIQRWNVGLTWGGFARTLGLAVYKRKASAKKRPRRGGGVSSAFDFKVQRIKEVKAGLRRRSAVQLDTNTESQLRGL